MLGTVLTSKVDLRPTRKAWVGGWPITTPDLLFGKLDRQNGATGTGEAKCL